MGLELRQQLKLTQQLIMTPQLQMAIKLLQLSRLELLDTIRQEMEENPALEEVQDSMEDSAQESPVEPMEPVGDEMREVTIEDRLRDDIDWTNYIDEFNTPGKASFETERRDQPSFESFISHKESIQEHLLWQLLMSAPSEEDEKIGSFIIGNLNNDGYLESTVEEIATQNELEIPKVEKILGLIQGFDPPGVGARDLKECLRIQIRQLELENTLVSDIIESHLNHLENSNYKAICKALKAKIEDVVQAVEIIKGLDPRPGRQFSEDTSQHITPDIFVYKYDDEFVIVLNDAGIPRLRVSNFYKIGMDHGPGADQTKAYIQDKMRSATWLIKSIHQRQKTIYRVMESILKTQRAFFEKGVSYLKPMVLRDVADDIGMHESTISRVTTNKYAHTPQGIFELKYFFNSSINRVHGEAIASASVKDKIKQIIDSENPRKPFSDHKITQLLEASNIQIARRTVAKYREALGVLPSSKRKRY